MNMMVQQVILKAQIANVDFRIKCTTTFHSPKIYVRCFRDYNYLTWGYFDKPLKNPCSPVLWILAPSACTHSHTSSVATSRLWGRNDVQDCKPRSIPGKWRPTVLVFEVANCWMQFCKAPGNISHGSGGCDVQHQEIYSLAAGFVVAGAEPSPLRANGPGRSLLGQRMSHCGCFLAWSGLLESGH